MRQLHQHVVPNPLFPKALAAPHIALQPRLATSPVPLELEAAGVPGKSRPVVGGLDLTACRP